MYHSSLRQPAPQSRSHHPHRQALGIPAHDLLREGCLPADWEPLQLESLRDLLHRQNRQERPREQVVPLRDCRFEFNHDGAAFLRIRGKRRFGRPRQMTTHALRQVVRRISRSGSSDLLEDLVRRGGSSNLRLASQLLSCLVGDRHGDRTIRFRTVRRDPEHWLDAFPTAAPGRTERIVIAAVGPQYRSYDDARFIADLNEQVPADLELQVISAWRTSEGLRVRAKLGNSEPDPYEPAPMIEFRNSEVGTGSATMTGSLFTLVCTNGMHGWGKGSIYRWPHRGDVDRIGPQISAAIQQVHAQAMESLVHYDLARSQTIGDHPEAVRTWLEQRQRRYRLSQGFIERTLDALTDPTTTGSSTGNFGLASVIDAITLQAQSASFSGTWEFERLAGRILEEELQVAA